MQSFGKISAILLTVLMASTTLTACESASRRDQISVTNADAGTGVSSGMQNAPGVQPVPQGTAMSDSQLKAMTSTVSGGSVEIYDMDTGNPYGGNDNTIQRDYLAADGGIPMANDPGVTVYPLDSAGAYETYGQMPRGPSGMTPPPVGGSMGLYNMAGDTNMPIEGGKLSPRTGGPVSSVYFPYGSANVGGNDRQALASVAEAAKFAPVDRIVVEGHASTPTQSNDPVEARILNLRQSLKRATKVSETLIEQGVPAEKIKTVGWGDTKPGPGGEAQQRRVDIVTAPGAAGY